MQVLFVCTGNTCRSPLAEVLLQRELVKLGVEGVEVASAGIAAFPGSPASQGSRWALQSPDLDKHRARLADAEIIGTADLILTMTEGHKESLGLQFPHAADKVSTLGQYAWGEATDIADPFGGGQEEYEVARREIEEAVIVVAQKLMHYIREVRRMKIALASDHGGFRLKEELKGVISQLGHSYQDFGAPSEESVDYPDLASSAARAVAAGTCDLGIVVCGTGIGMSIAANKVKGIRAANCSDCFSATMARAHNNANILTLGQRVLGSELAIMITKIFLDTPFEGERHQRRLDKIVVLEEDFCR